MTFDRLREFTHGGVGFLVLQDGTIVPVTFEGYARRKIPEGALLILDGEVAAQAAAVACARWEARRAS